MAEQDFSSYTQRTVILRDWWLVKCSQEFQGKQFGVAGMEIAASLETRAMRMFTSSPIINSFDVFTLKASDGICIILRGFLNKERLVQSGFSHEICRHFIFGFPPCWEKMCSEFYRGVSDISSTDPLSICKASCPISSPHKIGDKSTVTESETNMAQVDNNDKGCRSSGSRARVRKYTKSNKSLCKDRDDGRESLNKATGNGVGKDGCVAIIKSVKRHSRTDAVDKLTSKNACKESQQKVMVKVTKTTHSLGKVSAANSSKLANKGKSKQSEKAPCDKNVVEPMNNSVSKAQEAQESLLKRKIDFDMEVTPDKLVKKQIPVFDFEVTPDKLVKMQKSDAVSSDQSLSGQKRSRSGRVLVSPLEFWRNQIPVYDQGRNLIQVLEGNPHETMSPTSSKGKGSSSRKQRR